MPNSNHSQTSTVTYTSH